MHKNLPIMLKHSRKCGRMTHMCNSFFQAEERGYCYVKEQFITLKRERMMK